MRVGLVFDIASVATESAEAPLPPIVTDQNREAAVALLEGAIIVEDIEATLLQETQQLGFELAEAVERSDEWAKEIVENGVGHLANEELSLLLVDAKARAKIAKEFHGSSEPSYGSKTIDAWAPAIKRMFDNRGPSTYRPAYAPGQTNG